MRKAEQVTQEKQRSPLVQLKHEAKSLLPDFMPDEKSQKRMQNVLMVAVEKDSQLLFADRQSLFSAVRQCANQGLVPDGNEATLQVYNTKQGDNWIKKVQYQPMVRGIINRVLRSGKVTSFWADVVYKGEEFSIDTSQGDRRPHHVKANEFDRGEDADIVGVYAVAKMDNGSIDCEPLSRKEIEKIRKSAKTQKVWEAWFTEKAKVAALRRLSKRLPLSSEDMAMIMNEGEHDLDEAPPKDITPTEAGPTLSQRIKNEEPEPLDGEIVQEQEQIIDEEEPAYGEGMGAAEDGKAISTCPYMNDPHKMQHWMAGYKAITEKKQ